MEPRQSEPSYYLVATPRRVEVWLASKKPRVTVSKALTKAKVPGRSPSGRRTKRVQPVQLVKFTTRSTGTLLTSGSLGYVGRFRLQMLEMSSRVLDRLSWVRWGGYGKGERYLCTKVTRQQAEFFISSVTYMESR